MLGKLSQTTHISLRAFHSFAQRASLEVRWFVVNQVMSSQKPGSVVDEPVGDFCWVCGCTCEVWPLEEAKQVLERRSSDPAFRSQWAAVRAGVAKAVQHECRAQDVLSTKSLATRIICKAAFVTEDGFAQYFKMPVGSVPGVRLAAFTGPENQTISGVIMDLHSLPPACPHYIIETSATTQRTLQDTLLAQGELLRAGQAGDQYQYRCSRYVTGRESSLAKKGSANPPTAAEVQETVGRVQAARAEDAERRRLEMEGAGGDSAGGAIVNRITGSRLSEEDAEVAVKTPRPKRAGSARPAVESRKRGRGGGAASQPAGQGPGSSPGGPGGAPSVGLAASSCGGSPDMTTAGSVILAVDDADPDADIIMRPDQIEAICGGWAAGRQLKKARRGERTGFEGLGSCAEGRVSGRRRPCLSQDSRVRVLRLMRCVPLGTSPHDRWSTRSGAASRRTRRAGRSCRTAWTLARLQPRCRSRK